METIGVGPFNPDGSSTFATTEMKTSDPDFTQEFPTVGLGAFNPDGSLEFASTQMRTSDPDFTQEFPTVGFEAYSSAFPHVFLASEEMYVDYGYADYSVFPCTNIGTCDPSVGWEVDYEEGMFMSSTYHSGAFNAIAGMSESSHGNEGVSDSRNRCRSQQHDKARCKIHSKGYKPLVPGLVHPSSSLESSLKFSSVSDILDAPNLESEHLRPREEKCENYYNYIIRANELTTNNEGVEIMFTFNLKGLKGWGSSRSMALRALRSSTSIIFLRDGLLHLMLSLIEGPTVETDKPLVNIKVNIMQLPSSSTHFSHIESMMRRFLREILQEVINSSDRIQLIDLYSPVCGISLKMAKASTSAAKSNSNLPEKVPVSSKSAPVSSRGGPDSDQYRKMERICDLLKLCKKEDDIIFSYKVKQGEFMKLIPSGDEFSALSKFLAKHGLSLLEFPSGKSLKNKKDTSRLAIKTCLTGNLSLRSIMSLGYDVTQATLEFERVMRSFVRKIFIDENDAAEYITSFKFYPPGLYPSELTVNMQASEKQSDELKHRLQVYQIEVYRDGHLYDCLQKPKPQITPCSQCGRSCSCNQ